MSDLRRRELITLAGCAAVWPIAAGAQQAKVPVLGFLASASESRYTATVAAVRSGLSEAGFVEKQNLLIEYRWADFQYDRLPALAAELVKRLPTMTANGSYPARGGLISYAANVECGRRRRRPAGSKRARGEKPANLPVVQPTSFALRVNLKTAKALGLSIPETFLLLADEVIE
jgi:hypothetical protein